MSTPDMSRITINVCHRCGGTEMFAKDVQRVAAVSIHIDATACPQCDPKINELLPRLLTGLAGLATAAVEEVRHG